MNRRNFLGGALGAGWAMATRGARAGTRIRVLVPDADNLQYMSFWVAHARGYFDASIAVDIVTPSAPQQALAMLDEAKPDAAVLPPPMYLSLIADRKPWVLGANLLQNDPIDLVVRKSVAAAKGITLRLPLRERLERLRGVAMGIAPHPPPRLRALYASVGLDATKDASTITIGGKRQNAAFEAGDVDALYAHTPYLEHAVVHQDAVVVVDQSGGEVPILADRQIHALTFARAFLEGRRDDAAAMVRAIARAETILRTAPEEASAALMQLFPGRDKAETDTIVRLYNHAIPTTPQVRADALAPAAVFFPEGQEKPKLEGIDLATFVAPELGSTSPPAKSRSVLVGEVAIAAGVLGLLAYRLRSGRSRDPNAGQK